VAFQRQLHAVTVELNFMNPTVGANQLTKERLKKLVGDLEAGGIPSEARAGIVVALPVITMRLAS
jgi:hypothetical protein